MTLPLPDEELAAISADEETPDETSEEKPVVAIDTNEIDGKFLLPGMGIVFFLIALVGLITWLVSRSGKTIVKFHSKDKKVPPG